MAILCLPSDAGTWALRFLSQILLPLLGPDEEGALADALISGVSLFQENQRPEYYRETIDLVFSNPRPFVKLHEVAKIPVSVREHLPCIFF